MVDEAFSTPVLERRRARLFARAASRALALYGAAGMSYVALAVFFTQVMLSWVIAFAWLELWVWLIPAVIRRLRS